MTDKITCEESDVLRKGLKAWSSCTNYIKGEPSDYRFPPENYAEWCDDDWVVRLIDTLDADGCRHTKENRDMKEDDK